MATRSHVPQFGNWEGEENVPYTAFFDNARKGRGGRMINPNDPQENPDMFPNIASASSPPPPVKTKTQADEPNRRVSREEVARGDHTPGRRTAGESPHQQRSTHGSGSHSSQPARQGGGSEHSVDRSPMHSSQAKLSGRGGASPALDGKNSYDSSHGAPGKSRTKPATRGDETPDRGAAVPRFGEWDEKNPQSAENYTDIFNRVRDERHNVPSNVAGNNSQSPYHIRQQKRADNKAKGCCFPWLRK